MATSRKKPTKAQAAARVDEMFGGAGEDAAAQAVEQAVAADQREDRLGAELSGEQPPPLEKVVDGAARAWETYPILVGRCSTCSGSMRGTSPPTCRKGHAGEPVDQLGRYAGIVEATATAEEIAARVNAGTLPGVENASARVVDQRTIEVVAKRTGRGARVVFHERHTTRLEQLDVADVAAMNPADQDLAGAFVKITASLTPSEREAFDGQELKRQIRAHGARAVLLAVAPVAEAPSREAKREVSVAARPAEAIASWFDGLPVPEEDRAAAKAQALEILAAEEG